MGGCATSWIIAQWAGWRGRRSGDAGAARRAEELSVDTSEDGAAERMPSLLTAGKLFITGFKGRAVTSIDGSLWRKTHSLVILSHFFFFLNGSYLENATKMQSFKWRSTANDSVCVQIIAHARAFYSVKTVIDDHDNSRIQQQGLWSWFGFV